MTIDRDELAKLQQAASLGIIGVRARNRDFVLTGKMSMTREDMTTLIEACGGRVRPRITHGVNYLVSGDTGVHGYTSKMREADRLGIKNLTEEELVTLLTTPAGARA